MPVNRYFNHSPQNRTSEQSLYEDLLVENIKVYGHDVYYLPREDLDTTDKLFGENIQSYFERAYVVEMYINNTDWWSNGSDFFSKFGLGQHDQISLVVAKRSFEKHIPSNVMVRPREGDLIYVPAMQKIFEVTFVEENKDFFARGNKYPYTYEISVEAFRMSNEVLKTGVSEIDIMDDLTSWGVELQLEGVGSYDRGERVYQGANLAYSRANAKVSDWDGANNTIFLTEVVGQFEPGSNVIGTKTATSRFVANTDMMTDNTYYDLFDNKDIQAEANTIIDLSETNPFGAP